MNILPRPAYNPDNAPPGYSLFRSMDCLLKRWIFETYEDIKSWCDEFLPQNQRSGTISNPITGRNMSESC